MARYKIENFAMESPAFLSFIFNRLSVKKCTIMTKNKIASFLFRKGIYFVLPSSLDLKTRLKLQLEHYVFEMTTTSQLSVYSIP